LIIGYWLLVAGKPNNKQRIPTQQTKNPYPTNKESPTNKQQTTNNEQQITNNK